jgi:HSP20 family molecular chaperone IbpA
MMSRLNVKKIPEPSDRALPIFEEFDRRAERIRVEAYNLFASRGAVDGHELDDWLAAERELCGPGVEVAERKGEFVLSLGLDGFDPVDIDVTATPREILIKGEHKATRTGGARDFSAVSSCRWPSTSRKSPQNYSAAC